MPDPVHVHVPVPVPDSGVDAATAVGSPSIDFGPDRFISLPVAGFAPAIVAVPVGRTKPAPVFVAGHGNYDRPEWQCAVWSSLVQSRAIVLCPRGMRRPDSPSAEDVRFTYASADRYLAEVDAGLVALRERFEGAIDEGPVVYVGFSLGAIFGARFVQRPASHVERAVLVEGGHDAWTAPRARAFARAGGKRILFACGQSSCENDAERVKKLLVAEKVDVEVVHAPGVGHAYDGPVADKIRERFDWLVEGDERFAR